jgi:iron(III) transport system permease protein
MVLPGSIWHILCLFTGVGFSTSLVGTNIAWLVASSEFPLRRVMQWACLIPLAMPIYMRSYSHGTSSSMQVPCGQFYAT